MGKLRKALHTAVRLHRHSKLHNAKTDKAASVCQNKHTVEGQPETQTRNELQTKKAALMDSVSSKHQDRYARPPIEADEDAWANWEEKCVNERGKAAKQKERIVQLLRQKDSIAPKRHIQPMCNSNQKRWNKKIPYKITEHVHEAFQQQARPATGRTKTRKYLPGEVKRDYPLGGRCLP